jgi:hypothetical protein
MGKIVISTNVSFDGVVTVGDGLVFLTYEFVRDA